MNEQINFSTKKWYNRWWGISLILLGFFVSIFLIYFLYHTIRYTYLLKKGDYSYFDEIILDKMMKTPENDFTQWRAMIESPDDPSWGSEDAKVLIVEFADFKCPVCRKMYPVNREIMSKYQDQVKFIFRDMPIVSPSSLVYSQAGECADDQDLFWAMHDKMYQKQDELTELRLSSFAKEVGMDTDRFVKCLQTEKYKKEVYSDVVTGQELDIQATPTYFINGYKFTGELPKSALEKIIDKLLSEK